MVSSLRRCLRSFKVCVRANVAMTFALATIPVVGFVGSAVDYSRAHSMKAAMQGALDATALMLSKKAANMTPAQISSAATAYFSAVFTRPEAKNINVTASYSSDGGSQVLLSGSAALDTRFMGLFGYRTLRVGVTSTAKWGTTRLRIALALDNTGSMADDGKMDALKAAAKGFVAQMKAAATNNGDVYVSIIPFAKDVNIGKDNYKENYIEWTDFDDDGGAFSGLLCFGEYCWDGTTLVSAKAAKHKAWNGCVTDRGGSSGPDSNNYDQSVALPGTSAASKYPAEQYSQCPVTMMGLTYNWSALNNLIDSMTPQGSTNQSIGLVWAWQSLVGGGPLTAPAKDRNYTYTDVIILMSDGLNTQNRWYGNGSQVSAQVDNRMYNSATGAGTCANAKAAGVMIYAIQVNTTGDPTSALMQNCASTTDKFSQITSANQLVTTFNSIGTALTKLRIAN